MKASAVAEGMSAMVLNSFDGTSCGWTLARAHTRTGADSVALAEYLGQDDSSTRR